MIREWGNGGVCLSGLWHWAADQGEQVEMREDDNGATNLIVKAADGELLGYKISTLPCPGKFIMHNE